MRSSPSGTSGTLPTRLVPIVVPLLLGGAIAFGGFVRDGYMAAAIIQATSCAVLIWCVLDSRMRTLSNTAIWLLVFVVMAAAVGVLQLLPLPFDWWTSLPGRESLAGAFGLAGAGAPAQPFSMAPEQTAYGLLFLLPPVAMFVLAAKLPFRVLSGAIGWAIISIAVVSVGFGVAQTMFGDFPWPIPFGRNPGAQASGFFSVVNHQATLQLMALPFVAAVLARARLRATQGDAYQAEVVLAVSAMGAIVYGIIATGSVAGYALLLPVVIASLLIVFGAYRGLGLLAAIVGSLTLIGAIAFVFVDSPALGGLANTDLGSGPLSRNAIYGDAIEMIRDHLPLGTGLGSFEGLYPSYEDPDTVGRGYVSFVHNEYLQVALELGLPGCLLLIAFIAWWTIAAVVVWRQPPGGGKRLRQAASIAVAVVIVHSLVDFPARTPAIAVLAAFCCALLSTNSSRSGVGRSGQRDTSRYVHRHVEI